MNRSVTSLLATLALSCSVVSFALPVYAQEAPKTPATGEPTPTEPATTPPATNEPATTEPTGEPTGEPTVINSFEYECDAGKGFFAEFRSDRTIEATFGSKTLVLPQVEAASGARYSDGNVTISTRGDEAFVDVSDKRLFSNCVAQQVSPEEEMTDEPEIINSATYQCDDGKGFQADYLSNESVETTFGSKVMVLPQVESASGIRYSDGSVTLHSKGDGAFVQVGDNVLFENCVALETIEGLW